MNGRKLVEMVAARMSKIHEVASQKITPSRR